MTQEKKFLQICNDFVPLDGPGNYYVYYFLGTVTLGEPETIYCEDVGLHLAYRHNFNYHLPVNAEIAYAGQGVDDRIYADEGRFLLAPHSQRIIARKGLSRRDSLRLERILIDHFGRITGSEQGCLANINGKDRSSYTDYAWYRIHQAPRGGKVYAFTEDDNGVRVIIDHDYVSKLAQRFGATPDQVRNKIDAMKPWWLEYSGEYLATHFCWEEDYEDYLAIPTVCDVIFALNPDKSIFTSGNQQDLTINLGLSQGSLNRCLNGLQNPTRSTVHDRDLWFCRANLYKDFVIKPRKHNRIYEKKNWIIKATNLSSKEILQGTASAIGKAIGLARGGIIHTAITNGGTLKGYSFQYI